jgi:hypothetical protein
MTKTTVQVVRLSAGTVYKVAFIGSVFSLLLLCAVFGVLALFGFNTVSWNGAQVYGFWGLVTGLLLGGFFCLFVPAFFGSACAFGLWLYSKFERIHVSYFLPSPDSTEHASKDAASAA